MRVLALDSTTRAGSVAIVDDDRVIVERAGDAARTHAERLPGELLAALDEAGLSLSGIDLFAIASGPGSFTGLRVGIATIQGLAFARRARVSAISALDALAQIASRGRADGTVVGVWMDAHRREVFSALYRVAGEPLVSDDRLTPMEEAAVGSPDQTFERWAAAGLIPAVIIGDGAVMYARVADGRSQAMPAPAIAGALGVMAARRGSGQSIVPAA